MTYLLNILDLIFTLHAINNGGVELNPLMQSVPFMIFYKIIVIGALLLWLKKRKVNLMPITVVYAAVNMWHIYNIFMKGWLT